MKKKILITTLVMIIFILSWIAYQYVSILHIGEQAEPQPADVIIVLGAAVWPGGPSPALQARINHAVQLYNEGYAERLILSGGLGEHPPSEAEAMAVVAMARDIEEKALYLEKEARNTWENLQYSKKIMDRHEWEKAIIVTDVFHIKRALLIAGELEIEAYGAPAKNSALYRNSLFRFRYTTREVLALTAHYLLGPYYTSNPTTARF